jgi:hypothetical protein
MQCTSVKAMRATPQRLRSFTLERITSHHGFHLIAAIAKVRVDAALLSTTATDAIQNI